MNHHENARKFYLDNKDRTIRCHMINLLRDYYRRHNDYFQPYILSWWEKLY